MLLGTSYAWSQCLPLSAALFPLSVWPFLLDCTCRLPASVQGVPCPSTSWHCRLTFPQLSPLFPALRSSGLTSLYLAAVYGPSGAAFGSPASSARRPAGPRVASFTFLRFDLSIPLDPNRRSLRSSVRSCDMLRPCRLSVHVYALNHAMLSRYNSCRLPPISRAGKRNDPVALHSPRRRPSLDARTDSTLAIRRSRARPLLASRLMYASIGWTHASRR